MDKQDLSLVLEPGDKCYVKTAYVGYILREVASIKRGTITLVCGSKFDRYGKQKNTPRFTESEQLLLYKDGQKMVIKSKITKLYDEKASLIRRIESIDSDLAKLERHLNSIEDNL